MYVLRTAAAGALSAICAFVVVSAAGCGTDAVGIEDCRDIERARCEAGVSCGLVKDVEACKRFYRDHCLHGLALEDEPNRRSVENCAKSIRAAGECAKGLGAEAMLLDCPARPELRPGSTLTRACDLIAIPEETLDCDFLVPDDPPPVPDAGQDTGSGGAPGDSGPG
jgi:hypothetical protein